MFAAAVGSLKYRGANEQQAEGQQSEAAGKRCNRHRMGTEE